ncbi:hypothetical protein EDD17DRAFT_1514752 [Pisolithus thermaeus]|nr:hypothetical protein EDD17DRAFT_1514752 [Pisolithus thermaeus]
MLLASATETPPAGDRAVLAQWVVKRYATFQKFRVTRVPFIVHPQKSMEEFGELEILSPRTLSSLLPELISGTRPQAICTERRGFSNFNKREAWIRQEKGKHRQEGEYEGKSRRREQGGRGTNKGDNMEFKKGWVMMLLYKLKLSSGGHRTMTRGTIVCQADLFRTCTDIIMGRDPHHAESPSSPGTQEHPSLIHIRYSIASPQTPIPYSWCSLTKITIESAGHSHSVQASLSTFPTKYWAGPFVHIVSIVSDPKTLESGLTRVRAPSSQKAELPITPRLTINLCQVTLSGTLRSNFSWNTLTGCHTTTREKRTEKATPKDEAGAHNELTVKSNCGSTSQHTSKYDESRSFEFSVSHQ